MKIISDIFWNVILVLFGVLCITLLINVIIFFVAEAIELIKSFFLR